MYIYACVCIKYTHTCYIQLQHSIYIYCIIQYNTIYIYSIYIYCISGVYVWEVNVGEEMLTALAEVQEL